MEQTLSPCITSRVDTSWIRERSERKRGLIRAGFSCFLLKCRDYSVWAVSGRGCTCARTNSSLWSGSWAVLSSAKLLCSTVYIYFAETPVGDFFRSAFGLPLFFPPHLLVFNSPWDWVSCCSTVASTSVRSCKPFLGEEMRVGSSIRLKPSFSRFFFT